MEKGYSLIIFNKKTKGNVDKTLVEIIVFKL